MVGDRQAMNNVLEVSDLSFRYSDAKQKALEHINFTVAEGEFFCIIGRNESGKSTLCNALVGLIPFYFTGKMKGDVIVLGQNTRESSVADLASKIGFVFQNPFNQLSYTTITVAEELAYGLGNLGVEREEMLRRVERVAKLMRIDHLLHKSPLELSGGQVQRVALGSAFIMQPQILVLDECTTQLDPLGSEEVFDVVKDLNKSGVTVIMADHDMERVARCADRILVLDGGKQVAVGTPAEIFADAGILAHDIERPDFVAIGQAFTQKGLYSGGITLTEERTIAVAKEILAK